VPLFVLLGLFIAFQRSPTTPSIDIPLKTTFSGAYQIYFSRPQDPLSGTYKGGPDSQLVEAMDNAQFSIDLAIYHLNLWSVRDALIRADHRGVDVRVVVDDVHLGETEITALKREGIEVVSDHGPHLMHYKFVLIDRMEVWTGSMNLTVDGVYRNDNNIFRLRSREVAENYLREFEEMYIQNRFGSASLADTPNPKVNLGGIELEIYFSPDDNVQGRVVELIKDASQKLDLLAFAITSDPISNALIEAEQRKVEVRGVVEASQIHIMGSDVSRLLAEGIDLRLDENNNLMHHKVMVIDSSIVILGSYNFTRSAEEDNDENLIIIHDPALSEQFLIEFDRLFNAAKS
jgi:phosphatidylserine/phosphatidylglycerophosphate/cardiolipin synthase-like enzyme